MTTEDLARTLDLRRIGRTWRGPCPIHGGSSFTVADRDGVTVFYCWSGCNRREILKELRRRGLWPERERRELTATDRKRWAKAKREAEQLAEWRRWAAGTLRYWRNALWDRSRRAECWMAGDGRRVDIDHLHVRRAIEAMTSGARLGDQLDAALQNLERLTPTELMRIRSRLRLRRAAA